MWLKDFRSEEDNPYQDDPFVRITHLCRSEVQPDWHYPMHRHEEEFEIIFITGGDGILHIDNQRFDLSRGSILSLPPNTYHYLETPKSMRYYTMRFDSSPADGSMQSLYWKQGIALTSAAGTYLQYLEGSFDTLLNLAILSDGHADRPVQTNVLAMLQLIQVLYSEENLSIKTDSDHTMSDILHYIVENCYEKITLQSLGEKFAISPSHLSRLFSQTFHASPIDYLINARMARATEYLGKTSKSVTEISYLVGYDNPSYFRSLFTKKMGCTPTEYRERLSSHALPKTDEDIFPHAG